MRGSEQVEKIDMVMDYGRTWRHEYKLKKAGF